MINTISYRHFQRFTLGLLLSILLILLSSCTEDTKAQGILDVEDISKYETLYGCEKQVALDGLNLSQRDIDSENELFCIMNQERIISDERFNVILTFDLLKQKKVFSGITFTFETEDKNKANELIYTLFQLSKDSYGEPSTYEGTSNRISEMFPISGELSQGYLERWNIGEVTEYTLRMEQIKDSVNISLVYRLSAR